MIKEMEGLKNIYGPLKRINDSTYSINAESFANIVDTIVESITLACRLDTTIQFGFNDVTIAVCSDSNPILACHRWFLAINGLVGKNIKPKQISLSTYDAHINEIRTRIGDLN